MPRMGNNSVPLEGVMKTSILMTFFLLLMAAPVSAKKLKKAKPVRYLNKIYGQVHQNSSRFSRVISTFECGQPFKVQHFGDDEFSKVTYASYEGYILTSHLSKRRPKDCWQDQYRKYFDFLNLGISEMHHWGRLQDLFIEGSVMP